MRCIGIDLAWSPRHRSGGAVVAADGHVVEATAALRSDDDIVAFVARAVPADQPGLVAVDAPLAVPNEEGTRPCDRQVAAVFGSFQAAPYPANRRILLRYGGLRAESIRKQLQALGFRFDPNIARQTPSRQVFEVFPHPAAVSLFGLEQTLKYKTRPGRGYPLRWQELERLRCHLASLALTEPPLHLPLTVARMPIQGKRGQALKEAEDLLDALLCAYTALYAWYHGPGGYVVYGPSTSGPSDEQGHILIPMTPHMWERIGAEQKGRVRSGIC